MDRQTPKKVSHPRVPPLLPSLPHASAAHHKISSASSAPHLVSPNDRDSGFRSTYLRSLTPPNAARNSLRNTPSLNGRGARPSFVGDVIDIEKALEQIQQHKIANVQLREERTLLQTKIYRLETEIKKLTKKLNALSKNQASSLQEYNEGKSTTDSMHSSAEVISMLVTEKKRQNKDGAAQTEPMIRSDSESSGLSQHTREAKKEDPKNQSEGKGIIRIEEPSPEPEEVTISFDRHLSELKGKIKAFQEFLKTNDDPRKDQYATILNDMSYQLESDVGRPRSESSSKIPTRKSSIVPITSQITKVFRESTSECNSPFLDAKSSPKPLGLLKPKMPTSFLFSSSPNLVLPQAKRVAEIEEEPEITIAAPTLEKNPSVMEGISLMEASYDEFGTWWKEQPSHLHWDIAQELFYVIKGSNKVFEMTAKITFSQTIAEVVSKYKEGCSEIVSSEATYIFMIQGESQLSIFMETQNEDDFPVITIGKGIIGKAVSNGETVIVDDVLEHANYDGRSDRIPGMTLESMLIVPLADRSGQVYAAAVACNKTQGKFEEEDEVLMQALSDLLSNCLQQFKLLERTQRAQQRNKAISEVLKVVQNHSLPVDDVVSKVIEVTYETLNVDRVSLFLVDNITRELLLKVSKDKATIRLPMGVGIAGTVAETGEVINIRDAYKDPRFDQQFDKKSGYRTRTILCLPIIGTNKKPVAVMQLINKKSGFFTKDDEELMITFTGEAASAIQRKGIETAYQNLTTKKDSGAMQQIKGLLDEYITQPKHTDLATFSPLRALKSMPSMATIQGLKDWSLDHFSLSETDMMNMIISGFDILDLINQYRIERQTLVNFLDVIRTNYNKNPYHNFIHAFSVFQSCFIILTTTELSQYLAPLDVLSLLVAALCHDLDHPGTNNAFMVASHSPLAILYNDASVLENHHSSLAFQILKETNSNILSGLSDAERTELRKTVIPAILATDMSEHAKMTTSLSLHNNTFDRDKKEDRQFLINIVLHSSDLCNPVLPNKVSYEWASRVLEEFNQQARKEKELSLPVTAMMEKSDEVSKANLNIGFIRYVVRPLWSRLAEIFNELGECVERMDENVKTWEKIITESKNQ